jgi:hypothetical protein
MPIFLAFSCQALIRLHEMLPLTSKSSFYSPLQHLDVFYETFCRISSTTNTSRKFHTQKSFAEHCLTAHQQEIHEGAAPKCRKLSGFSHKTVMLATLPYDGRHAHTSPLHFLSLPSPSIKNARFSCPTKPS